MDSSDYPKNQSDCTNVYIAFSNNRNHLLFEQNWLTDDDDGNVKVDAKIKQNLGLERH